MKKKINKNSDYSLAHVLYQKLGTDWYAFTEVDGDCFMSKVDPSIVNGEQADDSNNQEKKTPKAA